MALAGRTGIVYITSLLLEDCEDIWTSGTKGVAAKEESAALVKVGDASAECTLANTPGTEAVAMYKTMATGTKNLTNYTHILCWAYSVPTTEAGDYRIGIGTEPAGASPQTYVTLPILTANTWRYCHCTEVVGSLMSATTVGSIISLYTWANGIDGDVIYLDDIQAAKTIAGIKSWTLDYTVDMLDTTDFTAGALTNNARTFLPGLSSWSGTFEGVKDGAPLTIFSQVGLELAESATVTQMWLGNVVITGIHPNVSTDGLVTYTYDYQGVGELIEASA